MALGTLSSGRLRWETWVPYRYRVDIRVWQKVGLLLIGLQIVLNVCASFATSEVSAGSLLTAGCVAIAAIAVYLAQLRTSSHATLLGWPVLGMLGEVAFGIATPQAASLSLGYFTLMFLYLVMTQPRWWVWVFIPPSLVYVGLILDLPTAQLLIRLTSSFLVWAAAAELTGYLLRQLDARQLQIIDHAGLDHLTGVRNRRDLTAALDSLDAESAILLIDVDDFKQVNDSDGHQAGDRLLSDLAAFLSASIRETDVVFRYGGDEFLVILPHIDMGEVQELVNRLVQGWARTSPAAQFSCGVAAGGPGSLARADAALYIDKERLRARTGREQSPSDASS